MSLVQIRVQLPIYLLHIFTVIITGAVGVVITDELTVALSYLAAIMVMLIYYYYYRRKVITISS